MKNEIVIVALILFCFLSPDAFGQDRDTKGPIKDSRKVKNLKFGCASCHQNFDMTNYSKLVIERYDEFRIASRQGKKEAINAHLLATKKLFNLNPNQINRFQLAAKGILTKDDRIGKRRAGVFKKIYEGKSPTVSLSQDDWDFVDQMIESKYLNKAVHNWKLEGPIPKTSVSELKKILNVRLWQMTAKKILDKQQYQDYLRSIKAK